MDFQANAGIQGRCVPAVAETTGMCHSEATLDKRYMRMALIYANAIKPVLMRGLLKFLDDLPVIVIKYER
jgi:hypothetical protein